MLNSEIEYKILGFKYHWHVFDEGVNHEQVPLDLTIQYDNFRVPCRHCSQACKLHDTRQRHLHDDEASGSSVWQHAHVPKIKCPECGKINMICYSLADNRARRTLHITDRVIHALLSNHIIGVVRNFGLTEKAVINIQNKSMEWRQSQRTGTAVDQVCRGEKRDLIIKIDRTLITKKHLVLMKPQNMNREMCRLLDEAVKHARQTGRAWAILEMSRCLWGYVSRTWARKMWLKLLYWMQRSRLEPMRREARMLKKHLDDILNAIVHKTTNALAESNNTKIKAIKVRANGYGSIEGFQNSILFHLGGLRLETGYQHPHQKSVSA